MQYMYEKAHKKIHDIYHVEKSTGSKIIYRHCGCDKCYKRRDNDQCNFSTKCMKNDNQNFANDLIKPCSVFISRLDLSGHYGNGFSNCCLSIPEMNNSNGLVTDIKVDKIEHDSLMTENEIENLSERNTDSVRDQMDLLFKSLCETFNLLRAKKKKYKGSKKGDHAVFSSCNSGKSGIKNASKKLIGNLYQGKTQITSNNFSKSAVTNFSCNYKLTCPPTLKNFRKIDKKGNFKNANENSIHSYEETDSEIENLAPSQKNTKSMQIKYLSSSKVETHHKTRACENPKIESGLLVDRGNSCSVPLADSTTKIFSRFPEKSNQDKAVQACDLLLSLNNSGPYCATNPKTKDFENNESREVQIEIMEEHIVQKNIMRTAKNVSDGNDTEFIRKNSMYSSNYNIKSIEKVEKDVIKNREDEIQILGEYIVTCNFKEATNKSSDYMCKVLMNENSHGNENEKYLEVDYSTGNKQIHMLNKVVKPCSVVVELMDEKLINLYSNSTKIILQDEANNCIPEIETVDQFKTDSCLSSSNLFISSPTVHKTFSRSSVGRNEQTVKYPGKFPLIKPCSVVIDKLPFDQCLKFINPTAKNSFCNENASFRNLMDESESCISEDKIVCLCKINFCSHSSDSTISSTIVEESSDIDAEQTVKYLGKIPLIIPCSVVIDKLPFDQCLKFINPSTKNSFCNENASFRNLMDETESCNSEEKTVSLCKINFYSHSSDSTISSTTVEESSNIDAVSKLAAVNKKTRKDPRNTPLIKSCNVVIQKYSVGKELLTRKASIKRQYSFLKYKRKNLMTFYRKKSQLLHRKNMFIKHSVLSKTRSQKLDKPFVDKKWKKEPKALKQKVEEWGKKFQMKDLNMSNCINVDEVSSTLLNENQHTCYESSDISPKCLSDSFRTDNCWVLLKNINAEDLNINNCRNVKFSSMLLRENQHICNTSSDILYAYPSSNLGTKDCFVLLERINVDEYLVENKNLFNNQCNLKCSLSSDALCKCSLNNFRIHDCYVLLERINVDECLAKNKNTCKVYDLSIQSENVSGSKCDFRNKYNTYKHSVNFVPNSRLWLKRESSLREKDTSNLNVKKLKRRTGHCTLGKTQKKFKTVDDHSNLICDSDYKCVQCRKPITTDVELYNHLCIGKRKKGYICDICEKIFETISGHKKHLNYHYKFIN